MEQQSFCRLEWFFFFFFWTYLLGQDNRIQDKPEEEFILPVFKKTHCSLESYSGKGSTSKKQIYRRIGCYTTQFLVSFLPSLFSSSLHLLIVVILLHVSFQSFKNVQCSGFKYSHNTRNHHTISRIFSSCQGESVYPLNSLPFFSVYFCYNHFHCYYGYWYTFGKECDKGKMGKVLIKKLKMSFRSW